MHFQIYQIVLLIAFLIAAFRHKHNRVPFLIEFLSVAVFFELVFGKLMKYYYGSNMISSNVFVIICVLYYLYLFTFEFRKRWFGVLGVIYAVAVLTSAWTQGFNTVMSFSYNTGMFLVLFVIFRYLYDLVIKDAYKPLFQFPLFWMAIGIMLFYSSSFPVLTFLNRFIASDTQLTMKLLDLLSLGNIFLSLGYFGAVICQWNTKTLSTSLR